MKGDLWTWMVLPLVLLGTTQGCLFGCSAAYWGGEDAGRTPGVHVRSATIFSPAELSVTSDLKAKIEKMKYTAATSGKGDTPATFELQGDFGQEVSPVVREQPAKIAAIAALQHEQSIYWDSMGKAVASWINEVAPIFNVMALAKIRTTDEGLTLTLPNGVTIGGHKVTTPADLLSYLQSLQYQAGKVSDVLAPTSQPAVVSEGGSEALKQILELKAAWEKADAQRRSQIGEIQNQVTELKEAAAPQPTPE